MNAVRKYVSEHVSKIVQIYILLVKVPFCESTTFYYSFNRDLHIENFVLVTIDA